MAGTRNLFTPPRGPLDAERIDILVQGGGALVERIFSTGQGTPPGQWYDQDTDEWVAVVQGEAELLFTDGSRQRLSAGDHLFIPARCRHRVEWTSVSPPCIWVAVHLPAGLAQPPDPASG